MNRVPIVISDVHGCIDELKDLLKLISYDYSKHRVIMVGDLLDRGPDPAGCVKLVRELGIESVMGNHEEKCIRWFQHEEMKKYTGKNNPVNIDENRKKQYKELTSADLVWIRNLPYYVHVKDETYVTHAGVSPHYKFANQPWRDIIRIRYLDGNGKMLNLNKDKSQPAGSVYWTSLWQGPETIIYGHNVHSYTNIKIDKTISGSECIGIDTGACFGGNLTAYFVETGEVAQVKARQAYKSLHRKF